MKDKFHDCVFNLRNIMLKYFEIAKGDLNDLYPSVVEYISTLSIEELTKLYKTLANIERKDIGDFLISYMNKNKKDE